MPWFPINRRHQRMATTTPKELPDLAYISFQSIGVTKEWRLALVAGTAAGAVAALVSNQ